MFSCSVLGKGCQQLASASLPLRICLRGRGVYPFTTLEAYRYSHHSPGTMQFLFPRFATIRLMTWKLKLSTTKTVTAAFHLYNKEATRELKVASEGRILPFSAEPTYLVVKLDRSLTYRRHLESLHQKLTTRVGLLRRLAESSWGAGSRTLRIATLALIHSAAEYCALVWSRSAHARLIKPINDALRLVTKCLRPTQTDNLFVLSGITLTELRRKRTTLSLACRAKEPGHLLHDRLTSHPYGEHRLLKSRHPFVPAALELLKDASKLGTSEARWADHMWSIGWREGTSRLHSFFDDVDAFPP